ncbi:MAG: RNA pseudouridine synthase [Candidatus Pelagibacter sp. TMED64]|nr:RNA pseudouridine synthase [Candidatus Pelagibacter sp.]OUU65822.1 MAG: RNA pseudouridine synthase [Candidatus Pelagibacter sp. TMED64]|tara:strand:+ start:79 stop:1062 length:984 start_codon:yes stop_codon:yes gene_type:complete
MQYNSQNFLVTKKYAGYRLDVYLKSVVEKISRTKLKDLIINGNIKLNGKNTLDPDKKVKEKDKLSVSFPKPQETKIIAYNLPLEIIYEDEDVILINKPSGMVVHPGAGNKNKTLVNALLYYCKKNLSEIGGKLRPGIVHRIDKDTSGLLIVAKNDFSHISLSKQFSDHSIDRTYEALVWGYLKPLKGFVNQKISRSNRNRQLMTVTQTKGKRAVTNYKTINVFRKKDIPTISHIECNLETGRTHQIRVHMSFKGNPIIGDKSYGKNKKVSKNVNLDLKNNLSNFNRQALHAKSLGFIHPRNGKKLFFSVSRPKDFEILLKKLKKYSK